MSQGEQLELINRNLDQYDDEKLKEIEELTSSKLLIENVKNCFSELEEKF